VEKQSISLGYIDFYKLGLLFSTRQKTWQFC